MYFEILIEKYSSQLLTLYKNAKLSRNIKEINEIESLMLFKLCKINLDERDTFFLLTCLLEQKRNHFAFFLKKNAEKALHQYYNSFLLRSLFFQYLSHSLQIEKYIELTNQYPVVHENPQQHKVNKEKFSFIFYIYLDIARAEFYTGNIKRTECIYRNLFPCAIQDKAELLMDLVIEMRTLTPHLDLIYDGIDALLMTKNKTFITELLLEDNTELTRENYNYHKQRILYVIEKIRKQGLSIQELSRIDAIFIQRTGDLCMNNLPVYIALANLLTENISHLKKEYPLALQRKKKIRIGINVSRYSDVTFKTALLSLFQFFDKERFELIFFAAKKWSHGDTLKQFQSCFDKIVLFDQLNWQHFRDILYEERLDIFLSENLIYPAPTFIFFARVAPIQITFWDRNISFATPYTDYYLVFGEKSIHHTWHSDPKMKHEHVALLNTCYMNPELNEVQPATVNMELIGLPSNARFIFYPQSLIRMMFDKENTDLFVIKELLEKNADVFFVALNAYGEKRTGHYYRWKKIMPTVMDRVLFLPRVSIEGYLWVIQRAACIVGSFMGAQGAFTNQTLFSQGVPLVAGYGDTFSSNLTKYHYHTMGVEGLLAENHKHAVDICQRLLDDPEWKAQKSKEILDNFYKLNNPKAAAAEMQDFLIQAYERALAGKEPENWDHGLFEDDPNYQPTIYPK